MIVRSKHRRESTIQDAKRLVGYEYQMLAGAVGVNEERIALEGRRW